MNKKGFTLIELLAVIVILGMIMAISSSALLKQKSKANVEEAKKLEHTIETLGPEVWLDEEVENKIGNFGLDTLTKYGLKSSQIKNPSGNGNCEGYLEVTKEKEFKGHICCPGLYQTDSDAKPTDCSSYKK